MTRPSRFMTAFATFAALLAPLLPAAAQSSCQGAGPQAPRDIGRAEGSNKAVFAFAPAASAMNLCNIHAHTNAEHKGPGFSTSAGVGQNGGWKCSGDESKNLNAAERVDPNHGHGGFGVKPGDSIEMHWVYTSCPVAPGNSLDACTCAGAVLRVESQVFLVVNDKAGARDFASYDYAGATGGKHQPKSLPEGTGTPVVYLGSTTGDKYGKDSCSTASVTWSVRPTCAKLDIGSLNAWAKDTRLFEQHAHGVRPLITDTSLLAPIPAAR